jgi:hypothetical protein
MKNSAKLGWIVFLVLVVASFSTLRAEQSAESKAAGASQGWLDLVDAGQYGASWEEAAAYFKGAVPKSQWERTMKALREPLGKVLSRKMKSVEYTRTLPGAPDGEYVVIRYETSFEAKRSAVELVIPMFDGDGRWRVSGYHIK